MGLEPIGNRANIFNRLNLHFPWRFSFWARLEGPTSSHLELLLFPPHSSQKISLSCNFCCQQPYPAAPAPPHPKSLASPPCQPPPRSPYSCSSSSWKPKSPPRWASPPRQGWSSSWCHLNQRSKTWWLSTRGKNNEVETAERRRRWSLFKIEYGNKKCNVQSPGGGAMWRAEKASWPDHTKAHLGGRVNFWSFCIRGYWWGKVVPGWVWVFKMNWWSRRRGLKRADRPDLV